MWLSVMGVIFLFDFVVAFVFLQTFVKLLIIWLTIRVVLVAHLTEHDNLVLGLGVLPTTEDQQVRTNSSGSVTESAGWGISQIFASLPAH